MMVRVKRQRESDVKTRKNPTSEVPLLQRQRRRQRGLAQQRQRRRCGFEVVFVSVCVCMCLPKNGGYKPYFNLAGTRSCVWLLFALRFARKRARVLVNRLFNVSAQ